MSKGNRASGAGALAMLVALVLACCQAHAEDAGAVNTAKQKLAGSTSREWIFEQIIERMGASAECTQGESYRFFSDGRLVVDKCEQGHLGETTHRWSMAQQGPLDLVMIIDGERYYMLFRDNGNAHLMRLQSRSDSKTRPTVDREFRLSED